MFRQPLRVESGSSGCRQGRQGADISTIFRVRYGIFLIQTVRTQRGMLRCTNCNRSPLPVPVHSRTHMHVRARCIGSFQKDYALFDVVSPGSRLPTRNHQRLDQSAWWIALRPGSCSSRRAELLHDPIVALNSSGRLLGSARHA